jgi:LPS sulfotransferase NodH
VSDEILIVSGLPRSGTSLMMQLLDAGGIPALTDHVRTADTDNPRGYYEFERVKRVKQDTTWLAQARGRAVKLVSQLLYDLPGSEHYRVVFMERDMEEVLDSQEKMLRRLGNTPAPRAEMARAFSLHLDRLHQWLAEQPNFAVLRVGYANLLADPAWAVERVNDFVGRRLDKAVAVTTVDPTLYRNRKADSPG